MTLDAAVRRAVKKYLKSGKLHDYRAIHQHVTELITSDHNQHTERLKSCRRCREEAHARSTSRSRT